MEIDRHVIDFFRWLHDVMWGRKRKQVPLIQKIGSPIRTQWGYLQEIRRFLPADIPDRDVSAWMFMPFRSGLKKEDVFDHYILCLSLAPVTGSSFWNPQNRTPQKRNRRRATDPTHRVIVGRCSRWLTSVDQFRAQIIFEMDYDLQGTDPYPNRTAVLIMRELVLTLKARPIDQIDWDFEIKALQKMNQVGQLR